MKIAYVDHAGSDLVRALARCMAAGGHDVWIVGHGPTNGPCSDRIWHIVLSADLEPKRWYFDVTHRHSDDVYAALQALDALVGLDVVEFPERGGTGFTTMRAKRLLDEFSHTTLAVRLEGPHSTQQLGTNRDFRRAIGAHLERYSLLHADVVTSSSHALADSVAAELGGINTQWVGPGPVLQPPTPSSAAGVRVQPPRLVFIGPLDPLTGADAFARIALQAMAANVALTFRMYGEDVNCAPFRTSYADHLRAQLCAGGADESWVSGPLDVAELSSVLDESTFCLFPGRAGGLSSVLPLALDRGCVVVADAAGPTAEVIEHGRSGLLLDAQAADAVVRELLACATPSTLMELSAGGRRHAAIHCGDDAVRSRLEAAYATPKPKPKARRRSQGEPRVSVVIGLYNQGRYLHEAIRSARASTHRNTEIVLVDDGSTDPQTIRVFEEARGVVKVRKVNGGTSSALNAGIAACSGNYVLPIGADDHIEPDYIAKALSALGRNQDLSYVGCYARYFGLLDLVYAPVGYVPELMLFLHTDVKTTSLFDIEAVHAVGGYDDDMFAFEDWDILIRLNAQGFQGDVLPTTLFSYRRHAESLVYTRSNFKRVELLQFMADKHHDLVAQQHPSVIAHLLHLWKSGYEPSSSVLQQMEAGAFEERIPQ